MDASREKPAVRCVVCAQSAEKLKCVKCKTPYCSAECQTVDWKERGHKKECKRLFKAIAAAVAKGSAPRDEAHPPSPKLKAAPPVVDGPARGRADVARARAAAAAATSTTAPVPKPEHWLGSARCPVCLEDWDVNATPTIMLCCCKTVCTPCSKKLSSTKSPCPLCRAPFPTSNKEYLAMLRRNVENGIPAAMRQLGFNYANGYLGLMPSHKKAARLYQRTADLGDVIAMFNLGFAYEHGEGIKIDKKKAVKYYRMAADRGHTGAQYNLGICYNRGDGVAQDYAEAMRFYKLAADKGLTHAEHNLGCMYLKGEGVTRDFAEFARWCERAAAKGHKGAKRALTRIMSLGF